jgi:Arc/MetJ family transcription regulator
VKTTVDIPKKELLEAMRHAAVRTKREAIETALREYNQRHRMKALLKYAGTCSTLTVPERLRTQRRRR